MKDRIGFVAVGQAGGNIGNKLEQKGYKGVYINTSKEDLDTLGTAKIKHHIKNGEGCNKDRLKAKQALIDDFDEVSRIIYETLDTEFIYVIFSSGGGTGSGAGPMLADLLLGDIADGVITKTKNIGIITILPSLREPVKTNINAYECFTELSKVEGLSGTFVIDNEMGDKMVLNNQFVNTFSSFLDIPNKHKSERGNIDKAEIIETLKAPGMIKLAQISAKESKTDVVIEKLNNGMFAESEQDGIVKYITISQSGNFDIDVFQKSVGMPIDIFTTYNEHSTICTISGLTYPAKRLDRAYEVVNDNKEKIMHSMNASTNIEMKEGINFLQESARGKTVVATRTESSTVPSGTGRASRRDIFKKYT